MRLADALRSDLVMTGLSAQDRDSVLEALATRLAEAGAVESADAVRDALIAREDAHTTSMGQGLALPHATIPGLSAPVLMVATAPEPIPFGPDDSGLVRLFFVLLSPPGHEGVHIKLLARICRLARHQEFVDGILGGATPEIVNEVILRIDREHV